MQHVDQPKLITLAPQTRGLFFTLMFGPDAKSSRGILDLVTCYWVFRPGNTGALFSTCDDKP